jgi:uncharacterized protein (DUF362 family)
VAIAAKRQWQLCGALLGEKQRPRKKTWPEQEVALLACSSYGDKLLRETIAALLKSLSFSIPYGAKIFLKPNLVTGARRDGLACTNAEFVVCVAEWFLAHGAKVTVGDSPAFGSSLQVMKACGMAAALQRLPVKLLDLKRKRRIMLNCGVPVWVSEDVLECDRLVNLPKIKAHSQMRVSLAVKNLFGAVLGCRKALAHMRYGEREGLFAALLVDLVSVLPAGVSIMDGIVAMHQKGPVNGEALHLGVAGASLNPVALDTAILRTLGVGEELSPLWLECQRRGLAGTSFEALSFPLLRPEALQGPEFIVPVALDPLRFQMGHFIKNGLRKVFRGAI